jgi:GntR family transcriptional regulator, rspAB operon transcriptional repressor
MYFSFVKRDNSLVYTGITENMKRNSDALSLSEQAYRQIRSSILSGRLGMGTPVSRRKLAEELGMSVVPVSDALQRLEAEELVESFPRVGTRIRVPSIQDVRGHYIVREALESQSARLFSQKASPQEREEIRQLARDLDAGYRRFGLGELSPAEAFHLHERHFRFHMRIAECSGYRALCQAIERNQVLTFNWLYDTAANRRTLPVDHHRSLAEALCKTDSEKANSAMRAHVMYGCEELLLQFETLLSPRLVSPAALG